MTRLRNFTHIALGTALVSLTVTAFAADDSKKDQSQQMEEVVVTGTRVADRSATDTAVPVDVVASSALTDTGNNEVNQALSKALPSFNFPRPSLNDGTDTIRPATLRGLAPDQTLVLVNSKRRHASSLVNVNGSIGRGAAAVDLNTIPAAAIQSVQVLRDGASAQYGSDAIAGVINVLLKQRGDGGGISVNYGIRDTKYTVPTGTPPTGATWTVPASISRTRHDGQTTTISGWKGLTIGQNGWLTLSGEYKDQAHSERGGYDVRQNYPLVGSAYDPRELTFNRFDNWYGDPEVKQGTLFANFGADLSGSAKLYGWASYQNRKARSAGFYRRAQDSRNVIAIYPDGFLPIIAPTVDDYSVALGETWQWGAWDMDTSIVYGYNKMHYIIENTLNASLGAASQTRFDAGGFDYGQAVFNFSGVRTVDVAGFSSPLNVATGIEARRESYSIFAGEPNSYINGDPTKASGSQVFPGFQPSDKLDKSRTAVGAYIDLEANVTQKLLATAALRGEHYSDFGGNISGKIALRYDFTDTFALRGSISNGFRAPSLQQQYFSATSTNFISGVPFDIKTFPVTDPRAEALGARPLKAEKSTNLSIGLVWQVGAGSITADAYQIKLKDRIVLSENLTQTEIANYLAGLGYVGVSGGRFFLNGVDTTTKGLEVVANWPIETDSAGLFKLTLAGSHNTTDVTKVPELSPALATLFAPNPAPPLFGRVNVLSYEKGQPKDKLTASVDWSMDKWGATLRATHYGDVLAPGSSATNDFWLGTKTLVDIDARYDFTDTIQLAVGANNLFDAYPPAFTTGQGGTPNLNSTGNTPFSGYTPYGFTGRLLYTRLTVNF